MVLCDMVITLGQRTSLESREHNEASAYFEFISVIEADLHGWYHPRLEQSAEDLVGHCICDEMKVKWVSPEKRDVDMLGFI